MSITVTLTSSLNPSDYLQPITFTVTTSQSLAGVMVFFTGTQQFGTTIVPSPVFTSQFVTTLLPVGDNDVTVQFTPYGSQTTYISNDLFQTVIPVADTVIGSLCPDGTPAFGSPAVCDNLGVLPAVANGSPPLWTEGNQELLSVDLAGNQRVTDILLDSTVVIAGSPAVPAVNVNVVNASGTTTIEPIAMVGDAPTAVSVGITSVQVVAANPLRTGVNITNTGSDVVSLSFGANPAVLYSGIILYPAASFWMDLQDFTTDAINAIASDSMGSLAVQEWN